LAQTDKARYRNNGTIVAAVAHRYLRYKWHRVDRRSSVILSFFEKEEEKKGL